MGENRYFQKALSDFTYETASGGAIRHLTDSGYTVKQIMERLDYPAPYERVRRTVWEHLVRQGTILPEPPGRGEPKEKIIYVREYDSYGKASFRRVIVREAGEEAVSEWAERPVDSGQTEAALFTLLRGEQEVNGTDRSYASLDFGLVSRKDSTRYMEMLSLLDDGQREYVEGLPWEACRVYHRLDRRVLEILARLGAAGYYQGECYFLKTGELLKF